MIKQQKKINLEEKIISSIIKKNNNYVSTRVMFGNNRSFSNNASRRSFKNNSQTIKIGNKKYVLKAKFLKTYYKNLFSKKI